MKQSLTELTMINYGVGFNRHRVKTNAGRKLRNKFTFQEKSTKFENVTIVFNLLYQFFKLKQTKN